MPRIKHVFIKNWLKEWIWIYSGQEKYSKQTVKSEEERMLALFIFLSHNIWKQET